MSQNTTTVADARPNTFTPCGEMLWRWIGWAFAAYWLLFTWGALTHRKELNTVGGIIVLAVLGWAVVERLWVKVDGVVVACLAAMLLPLVRLFSGEGLQYPEAIFKWESLCAVVAMARLLRLPLVSHSKFRWAIAVPVLIILLISMLVDRGNSAGDAARHSGLFTNPNNLALIPFLLLFFIDERRDRLAVRVGVHAIVIGGLAFSGTSGAILAYAMGLAFHLRHRITPGVRLLVVTLVLAGGSMAAALLIAGGDDFLPETRLMKQLSLMHSEFQIVLQGGELRYYDQERVLGSGTTSGIWRLAHWRRTITTYLEGTPSQQLFGFGIGSTPVVLGKLPHNEYLRILFEQGIAGFILFVFVWRRVLMTAPAGVRYVGLIIAIYSFSENNLDNFPFMSLFVLFLSASEFFARRDSIQNAFPAGDRPVIGLRQPLDLFPTTTL
jgi:hypothetical protein